MDRKVFLILTTIIKKIQRETFLKMFKIDVMEHGQLWKREIRPKCRWMGSNKQRGHD